MAGVTRIRKGPHPTPRGKEVDPLSWEDILPDSRTRALLAIAGVAVAVSSVIGVGVAKFGEYQRKDIPTDVRSSEQPKGNPSDPETYNPSGIMTSGAESE